MYRYIHICTYIYIYIHIYIDIYIHQCVKHKQILFVIQQTNINNNNNR